MISCNAKDDDDPCARIANEFKQSNEDLKFSSKYSDVIACYESFPYERRLAEKVNEVNYFHFKFNPYTCFFINCIYFFRRHRFNKENASRILHIFIRS